MQLRELPKEFRVRLRPSGTELKLGAMSDLLIHPQEDGRCWVYEAYRNELGLSGLNGLLLLYGPCTMEKALTFIDGYRAGRAKENRREPERPCDGAVLMAKIKVTTRVLVETRHGITAGRVFPTVRHPEGKGGTWVEGDAGELVRLLPHEFEVAK